MREQGLTEEPLHRYLAQPLMGSTRTIIEETARPGYAIDVYARLLKEGIITVGTTIDAELANLLQALLLWLEAEDPRRDITLYINSPGGSVYAGLSIYDTMQYIQCDVATVCTGLAASMGAVLLVGGTAGKRTILPHGRVMVHQPLGEARGQTSDMEISLKQMVEVRKDLYHILAQHTGQSFAAIEAMSDRDYWMRAEQAVEKGFVDKILTRKHS